MDNQKKTLLNAMARFFTVYLIFLLCVATATATTSATVTSTNPTGNGTGEIDFDTLMNLYGVNPELAQELRQNLLKAIAAEKEPEKIRQGEFGGVSGGFFQGGAGGGSGGGGGGNRPGGGGGGGGDEDYDEDDGMGATTQGPGFFGVLSGLFGVASGVGSGNPTRVLQSMVNFFPPSRRGQVQMFVDQLIGFIPQDNRTVRPRPRPSAMGVTPSPILGMMTGTGAEVGNAGVPGTVVAKGGEDEVIGNGTTTNSNSNATMDETDIFDVLASLLPLIEQLEGFEEDNDTDTSSINMSLVDEIVEAETEATTINLNVSSSVS